MSAENCNFGSNFNRNRTVLTGIIANYLTQHRRLVVPQLGTFIVKVPEGGVVFSELLKRDDGVLRGLLVQLGGMNDLEAAGAIDRFVFEVRHALEHGGSYAIEGFGCLTLSPVGAIVFQPDPAKPAAEEVSDKPVSEQRKEMARVDSSSVKPQSRLVSGHPVDASGRPVESDVQPRLTVSPKRKPEPYVKGLQYGKPLKTTEGYTYVGSKPRRRIDKFMVIAIVVAVLAVGVIVYGYLRRAKIDRLEREYLEQVTPPVQGTAAVPESDTEPTPEAK